MSCGGQSEAPPRQRRTPDVGTDRIGILGKVPWHDEFLRFRVEGDAVRQLRRLVDRKRRVGVLARRHGLERGLRARRNPRVRVSARRDDADALLARSALAPSSDGAGRGFPLVVASPIAHALELARRPRRCRSCSKSSGRSRATFSSKFARKGVSIWSSAFSTSEC